MSESTWDELDRLHMEARARARRRHRIAQESFERATPRGVIVCERCGAAVPHYVVRYGCQECGVSNAKAEVSE